MTRSSAALRDLRRDVRCQRHEARDAHDRHQPPSCVCYLTNYSEAPRGKCEGFASLEAVLIARAFARAFESEERVTTREASIAADGHGGCGRLRVLRRVCASAGRRPGGSQGRRSRAPRRRAEGRRARRPIAESDHLLRYQRGQRRRRKLWGTGGSDAHCAQLAQAATCRLSGRPGVRIERGSRQRQPSVMRATGLAPALAQCARRRDCRHVADLHGDVQRDRNSINKQQALSEKAQPIQAPATRRTNTTS